MSLRVIDSDGEEDGVDFNFLLKSVCLGLF
jgi:hypothetical protein